MNMIALVHQTTRKLTLVGLLLFPFLAIPGHAVELVGKPVAVGRPSSTEASSSQLSSQQAQVETAVAASQAAVLESVARGADDVQSARNDIAHAMDDVRDSFGHHEDTDFSQLMSPDIIVPVVAMSLLFGGPVLLVIILALLHYRSKSRRQKNINMNIDKLLAAGRDIPIELLLGEEPRVIKTRNQVGDVVYARSDEMMRKGIRNIGLGVGWLIFLTIMSGIDIGSFGFIFIGLGISQVIIWRLSDNNAPASSSSDKHVSGGGYSDNAYTGNGSSGNNTSEKHFSDGRSADKQFADKLSTSQTVDPVKVQD